MGSGEASATQVPRPGGLAPQVHHARRQSSLAREVLRPFADEPPTGGSGHVLVPLGGPRSHHHLTRVTPKRSIRSECSENFFCSENFVKFRGVRWGYGLWAYGEAAENSVSTGSSF